MNQYYFIRLCLIWLFCSALISSCTKDEDRQFEELCAGLDRVAYLDKPIEHLECIGTRWVKADQSIKAALASLNEEVLVHILREQNITGLLLPIQPSVQGESIQAHLSKGQWVSQFRTITWTETHVLVELYETPIFSNEALQALSEVARKVFEGTTPPQLSQFPHSLREPFSIEVMVLLREQGTARFWRSARGGSVASCLLTALNVSKQRWDERADALGGTLASRIGSLDVEVWFLYENGTYVLRQRSLIERTLQWGHGPGFEEHHAWQYALPEVLQLDRGISAFHKLLREQGMDEHGLERSDLRFYRFFPVRVATSRAQTQP